MNNFTFYNPTKIIFGKGELTQLDSLVPKNSKVLVLYGGGSVKKFGTLNIVFEELKKSPRVLFEFGGIEPNPKFETLMKAVEICRKEKIEFLLAVGGGSVMDGTKFISIAVSAKEYVGREKELVYSGHNGVTLKSALPIGTVVTLPATGSEMNSGGVITLGKDKLAISNPLTFPVFSILDPTLTYTLPPTQVANGIIDTFIHTIEQYLTYPINATFQDRTSEGILKTMIEIGRKTIDNPTNYDLRANLVWNSTMALNGLIGAGVPQDWSTHILGHELTAVFGIDHAKTLAVVLPALWKVRIDKKEEKLAQYAKRVWHITEGTTREKAFKAIEKTEEFFQNLGISTKLSDYGVTEKQLEEVVEGLIRHKFIALSETGDLTPKIAKEIYLKAL
ncbi:MAG: iron-containing alcohol dehydrogenase [Fusobacteriaceae bacterium]